MGSNEQLKLQRHQLYCSIADACQQGVLQGADHDATAMLGQLHSVLEAEACMSCDGNSEGFIADSSAAGSFQEPAITLPGTAALHGTCTAQHTPRKSRMPLSASKSNVNAVTAIQQLKQELAQQVQAALLPHTAASGIKGQRAISKMSAQAAALRQKHKYEQEVMAWKLAAQQATALAEAAEKHAAGLEAQLTAQSQTLKAQAKQVADQAQTTLTVGQQLKQAHHELDSMVAIQHQLFNEVLQPLLSWHQSSSSSCHIHHRALTPAKSNGCLTDQVIQSASAAVEQLLLQDIGQQQAIAAAQAGSEMQVAKQKQQWQTTLQHLEGKHQFAEGQVSSLQAQLQQAKYELQAVQAQSAAMHQQQQQLQAQAAADAASHAQQLQQLKEQHSLQSAAKVEEVTAAVKVEEAKHLQAKEQCVHELQQQLAQLLRELEVAQHKAAKDEQQVADMQQQLQQVSAELEQQQLAHQRDLEARVLEQQTKDFAQQQAALQLLAAEQAAAVQAAEAEANQALQAARREHQLALAEAKQTWEQHKAALQKEKMDAVLQAKLAGKKSLEDEKQQWQLARDALLQKLTAEHTAAVLQAQADAQQQKRQLLEQITQLRQEQDSLLSAARATEATAAANFQQLGVGICADQHVAAEVANGAGGYAVQFSQALTAADTDRRLALKQAAAAQQQAQHLQQQLEHQEQELQHQRRALAELGSACKASNIACYEAEASSAASAAALQKQADKVQQLQDELQHQKRQHELKLRALQESMKQQVLVIQRDARAELEAAQSRLQLLRVKQQCIASAILANGHTA